MLKIGSLNRIFLCWGPSSLSSFGRRLLSYVLGYALSCVLSGAIALLSFASPVFASPIITSMGPASFTLPVITAQIDPALAAIDSAAIDSAAIDSAAVDSAAVDSADITADKIDQFTQAYLQVLQLLSDRESEIPAAETTAEALKIEQAIEADAIKIIQDSGLTTPEYMQILGLASQDSAFQDKVLGRMDESAEDT